MIKRTLGLRGIEAANAKPASELFSGSVSLVFPGEDIVPAAKLLVEFVKSSQDKVVIRGGWIEGQLLTSKSVVELASLPPKPQLIAEVIAALESPFTGLIFGIEQRLGELVWILEEASKARPQAAEATPPTTQTQQEEPHA